MEELRKGAEAAKRVATACNILNREKVTTADINMEETLVIIAKLAKEKGIATLSKLGGRECFAILKELEKNGLAKVVETPFRTYAILTEKGWEVARFLLPSLNGGRDTSLPQRAQDIRAPQDKAI